MKFFLCCFAALALLPTGPASSRAPDEGVSTRTVHLNDLDLANAEHRAVLDVRIKSAAHAICVRLNGLDGAATAECIARSVQAARPQRNREIARSLARVKADRS